MTKLFLPPEEGTVPLEKGTFRPPNSNNSNKTLEFESESTKIWPRNVLLILGVNILHAISWKHTIFWAFFWHLWSKGVRCSRVLPKLCFINKHIYMYINLCIYAYMQGVAFRSKPTSYKKLMGEKQKTTHFGQRSTPERNLHDKTP